MKTTNRQILFTSFLFLSILHLASCELDKGAFRQSYLPPEDPAVNISDIFTVQPVRRPSPGIIPEAPAWRAYACDRYYEWYKNKTGIASKSLLSCCLFGSKSGFCKPELFAAQPDQNFLCNNDTERAPRSNETKGQPIGQCCVFARGSDKFEYECLEDQTWRECDCEGRDNRCQVEDVACDCIADYRVPEFKPVSKYMKAGVRLIAQKCRARQESEPPLQAIQISCCGLSVPDRTYCEYYESIGYC